MRGPDKSEWDRINHNRIMNGKLKYRSEQQWSGEHAGSLLGSIVLLSVGGAKKYNKWKKENKQAGFAEVLGWPTLIALPFAVYFIMNSSVKPHPDPLENLIGAILFFFCVGYGGLRLLLFMKADAERRNNSDATGTELNSGGFNNEQEDIYIHK